jgi:nucleotide-binding universal stress UspA family protein
MISRVLCAVDGSGHSKRALGFAAVLASKHDAELTLLAVVPVTLGRGVKKPLWSDSEVRKILSTAAKAAKKVGAKQVDRIAASARDVARAILTVAEEKGFDHIVVGAGGKSVAERLIIGSVSSAVVNKSHCSVTVVR